MEDFIEALQKSRLFEGVRAADVRAMLGCLGPRERRFDRGETVFAAESRAESMGIVLSGSVCVVRHDIYGNRTILAHVEEGGMFGEAFACAGVARLPVAVEGAQPGRAMVFPIRRITETCSNACAFHNRLVMNLLKAMAEKNLQLNRKLEITSRRSTREKLMAYLLAQAAEAGDNRFTIPFDRQGLADYLCVERSALSAEIGKLRREGILESEKSRFTLLERE